MHYRNVTSHPFTSSSRTVDGSDRRYGNIVEAVLGESLYKVMLDWGKDDEAKEQDKMRVKKMKRQIIRRAARAAGR